MSHEIYKRFRPKTLTRVVGNKQSVTALQQMLEDGEVPHTILFSGPSGCGKTTLARILCRELECSPLDLVELNCSSARGIDTVRDIARQMNLAPSGGKCRVWLLDEVHQMSKDGQHAMLKMLEDTPSHVYFFLCTTDPGKLLPTIRNRATPCPVEHPKPDEMKKLLRRVLKKVKIPHLLGDVFDELIHMNSPRAMLVMLDKVRHLHGKEQEEALRLPDEEQKEAIDLCRALMRGAKWPEIAKLLRTIKTEPESVRWAVIMYSRALLLAGKPQAFPIICAFEDNFFDSKEAGLARACWEVVNGGD